MKSGIYNPLIWGWGDLTMDTDALLPSCFLEGSQGSDGQSGEDGADGAAGSPGSQGAPGSTGPTGPDGDKGPTGRPGEDGAPGESIPGDKGDTGDPGETGRPGEDGEYSFPLLANPSKQDTLNLCWFNVGPASATLTQATYVQCIMLSP